MHFSIIIALLFSLSRATLLLNNSIRNLWAASDDQIYRQQIHKRGDPPFDSPSASPDHNEHPAIVKATLKGPGMIRVYKGKQRQDAHWGPDIADEEYKGQDGGYIDQSFKHKDKLRVVIEPKNGGKGTLNASARRVWTGAHTDWTRRTDKERKQGLSEQQREREQRNESKRHKAFAQSRDNLPGKAGHVVLKGKDQGGAVRASSNRVDMPATAIGSLKGKGELRAIASNSPSNSPPRPRIPSTMQIINSKMFDKTSRELQ